MIGRDPHPDPFRSTESEDGPAMPTPTHALPVALADQLAAATAHARRTLEQAGASVPGAVYTPGNPSRWLERHVSALRAALTAHRARLCHHIGPSPRVAHAAVWAPGVLVCPACIRHLTPNPTEDHTCDRCRRPADRLHTGAAAVGPVLLAYGLCTPCQRLAALGPRSVPSPRRARRSPTRKGERA